MKRNLIVAFSVALLALIASSTLCIFQRADAQAGSGDDDAFYVGVTYCGDSVSDAKQLIDKVKDYTNLFVLQSGSLQNSNSSIYAIGDYAVSCNMSYIVYLGINNIALADNWLSGYDDRWGNHFLGIYAIDEPGGKMLDGEMTLYRGETDPWLNKRADGSINGNVKEFGFSVTYMRNGTVSIDNYDSTLPFNYIIYYPNGTVAGSAYDKNFNFNISVLNDTSKLQYTYDELWAAYPLQTQKDARQYYTGFIGTEVNQTRHFQNTTLNVITSDYGLHWYDYQSGYDAVLAQFCWNESTTQAIASVRGAANCYGKDWGAIITWKYTEAPYLASGEEIYQQMSAAYRNGAKYVVLFNYAPDMKGAYGTLQEEHFDVLEQFWTDTVNNASVIRGQVKAEAAFVLPQDFGSGLRRQDDVVWGLWEPTEGEQQVWLQLQNAIAEYGEKLDIVYNDTAYPAVGKYSELIYPSQALLSGWLVITLIIATTAGVLVVLMVAKRVRKRGSLVKL
ncbi:MAG: hypothetical protein NWE93_11655 [Candidatus Bathyarchaeota archaeon]|nr:hypothetical protein [Candidatus Bathyarchaeota archaeon]